MLRLVKLLRRDEKGATAIEYALIAGLIAVAAITLMSQVGASLRTVFTNVSTELNDSAASDD
jgi:pilus assembly protein Flp/PilA